MKPKISDPRLPLLPFALMFGLAACETTKGFGEDVESAGEEIEETAEDVQD